MLDNISRIHGSITQSENENFRLELINIIFTRKTTTINILLNINNFNQRGFVYIYRKYLERALNGCKY